MSTPKDKTLYKVGVERPNELPILIEFDQVCRLQWFCMSAIELSRNDGFKWNGAKWSACYHELTSNAIVCSVCAVMVL